MPLEPARLLELAQAHETAEFSGDLDATMATLIDRPVYLWFPQRLKIEGREAVREMYARLMPMIDQMKAGIADRRIFFMATGEDQLAAEIDFDYRFEDGRTKKVRIAAFLQFVGEKMVGETQYVDQDLAGVVDALFDAEFMALPGVSRI